MLFKGLTYSAAVFTIILLFGIILSIFFAGAPVVSHDLGPLTVNAKTNKYLLPWIAAEYKTSVKAYLDITLAGEPAQANDRIAAFVGSECRGFAEIYIEDNWSVADLDILLKDSNKADEIITFAIYDHSSDSVYEADFSRVLSTGKNIAEPDYRFQLTAFIPPIYPLPWQRLDHKKHTTAWLQISIDEIPAQPGDMVGAFVNGKCRGSTLIPANGSHKIKINIQGNSVEYVNFAIWDESNNIVLPVNYTTHTNPGETIGYPPDKSVLLQLFHRITDFVGSSIWHPTQDPGEFGILALILGSLLATAGALLLAIPFGIGSAIYISEIASPRAREVIKPIIELLAGLPSVVYGLFGMAFLSPILMKLFHLDTGLNAFNAAIILGIMVIPIISSMSEDALSSVPKNLRHASYGLGANRWETIIRVVLPAAKTGVIGSILLGFGRAIGETMVVIMVAGGSPQIPSSIFKPVRPMTAAIASEMGETAHGTMHFHALFGIAIILFIITFVTNLISEFTFYKQKG